jgi:hypothetical protein
MAAGLDCLFQTFNGYFGIEFRRFLLSVTLIKVFLKKIVSHTYFHAVLPHQEARFMARSGLLSNIDAQDQASASFA